MEVENILFWVSVAFTCVVLRWNFRHPLSDLKLKRINHVLLALLPAVIILHGADYIFPQHRLLWLGYLEHSIFPVYAGVIILHVKENILFFGKVP